MAKVYPVSVAAPDLSHVLQWSASAGRNQGYNDFMEGWLDHQYDMEEERLKAQQKAAQAQADAAAKAAKAKVAEEESKDPKSEGFWDSLGDRGLDGLNWTMDQLSRFSYASAGIAKASQGTQEDETKKEHDSKLNQFFDAINPVHDLSWHETKTMFSEGWKGFTLKEKPTYADVIKSAGKRHKGKDIQDNKWFQGIAGFAGDVLLDPTTYIGVGIVPKVLKGSQLAAKGVKGSEEVAGLAEDIAKLNIRQPGREVPLTADEVKGMLGMSSGVRTGSRKAQQAAQARLYTENMPRLKKWIKDDPFLDTDSTIKSLDEAIDLHRVEYDRHLSEYQKEAYIRAADDFDAKSDDWHYHNWGKNVRVGDDVATAAPLAHLKNAFDQGNFAKVKGKPAAENQALFESKFDEVMGDAYKNDPRFSPEFRKEVHAKVNDRVKKNKAFRTASKRVGQISEKTSIQQARIAKAREAIKAAEKEGGDKASIPGHRAVIDNATKIIRNNGKAQAHAFSEMNHQKSVVFRDLLEEHSGGRMTYSQEQTDRLHALTERRRELEDELDRTPEGKDYWLNSEQGDEMYNAGVKTSGEQSVPRDKSITGEVGPNQGKVESHFEATPMDEIKNINREIEQIEGDLIARGDRVDVPENLISKDADFEVTERYLTNKDAENPEFHATINREVEKVTANEVERLTQSTLRGARESKVIEKTLGPIKKMFGPSSKKKGASKSIREDYQTPKITVAGKAIAQDDKEALSAFVKQEDIDEAFKKSGKPKGDAPEPPTLEKVFGDKVPDDLEGLSIEAVKKLHTAHAKYADEYDAWMKASKLTTDPRHVAFERMFKAEHGMSVHAASVARKTAIADYHKALKAEGGQAKPGTSELPGPKRAEIEKEARKNAIESINKQLASGGLRTVSRPDFKFLSQKGMDEVADLHRAARSAARARYAQKAAEAKGDPTLYGAALREKLAELEGEKAGTLAAHDKIYQEAVKTREAMAERLDEQITLNMLQENIAKQAKAFRFTAAGKKIVDIPVPKVLTAATEKMGGLPILRSANKIWSDSFTPASKADPDLNLARLRAQSRTPDIIKHHVDDIRHKFGGYKPAMRRDALRAMAKGAPAGDLQLYDDMVAYFDDFTRYTTGKVTVGGEALKISDINKKLPEDYRFLTPKEGGQVDALDLSDARKLIESMRRLPDNADPMKVMWNLKIASEQALAEKAMHQTITGLFGVKRIGPAERAAMEASDDAEKIAIHGERNKLIEDLHNNHKWTTVAEIGEGHYFAPDTAEEIKKLLKMMKPQNVHEAMKVYDKVIRAWKSAVTVYNPGYYTRNGIGETIMGMFDGLTNPKWYSKAAGVLRYSMPDHMDETLKSLEPWKRHASMRQKGSRHALTLKGGEKLNYEDVWVLYHDAGLKSGFISSEYDHYFPAAGSLKASPVGKVATKINDSIRHNGEKYEDYFRLSHFMYRMAKSGHRTPQKAAEDAAKYVRKYHFDYTDFTPFEKTTMMRVFPFYKWTRKALPLMGSMLFTNPGKIMLYPKGMQNLSYATGGTDPSKDENGFMPNYEDVTPEWMQSMLGYPIGRDQEGNMDYMNVATPSFDVYKMMAHPASAALGMLSPGITVPIEQATGKTLDPGFEFDVKSGNERLQNLLRTTPAGSLGLNIAKGNEEDADSAVTEAPNRLDERLTSFLTGLGFYENNPERQDFEKERRDKENR